MGHCRAKTFQNNAIGGDVINAIRANILKNDLINGGMGRLL